jgi:hypothetical protein
MFLKNTSVGRALGLVALIVLGTCAPLSLADAMGARVSLGHQDAVAVLSKSGAAKFQVALSSTAVGIEHLTVTLYPALNGPGQIAGLADRHSDTATPLATTSLDALHCVVDHQLSFAVVIGARQPSAPQGPCGATAAALVVPCALGACTGVYPLHYSATIDGRVSSWWTLAGVLGRNSTSPLRVAVVGTVVGRSPEASTSALRVFANKPSLPLSVGLNYASVLAALNRPTSSYAVSLRGALAGHAHSYVNTPPTSVDEAGLVATGFQASAQDELGLTGLLLSQLGVGSASPATYLAGSPSAGTVSAYRASGASALLVNESALTQAPSATLTWGSPFTLASQSAAPVVATFAPLDHLALDGALSFAQRADFVEAELSLLYNEAPNSARTRTVVLSTPLEHTTAGYWSTLLQGLSSDPDVRLVSVASALNAKGTLGALSLRNQAVGTPWSPVASYRYVADVAEVSSLSHSFSAKLEGDQLLATLEASAVRGSNTQLLNALESNDQLISVVQHSVGINQSSITLTGSGASIPVTLLYSGSSPLAVQVRLVTSSLTFPKGNTLRVVLSHPTQALRVPVIDPSGSSFTLQVVVTTADGSFVLTRSALSVHYTRTSAVGYLISLGSIVVLALWWARTFRRRRRLRSVS